MTMRRIVCWLGLCVLLLTTACGRQPDSYPSDGRPALWRVQGPSLDGWLLGTIHVLPQGIRWRTGAIDKAIKSADRLVLETAEIRDPARTTALFEKMGRSPDLPPLEQRLPPDATEELKRIADQGGTSTRALSTYESWAAAMLLSAAAQRPLRIDADEGVEPVLIRTFEQAGKAVDGLETVERQFGAFDALPEAAQRRLLAQTVEESPTIGALYGSILRAWLKGDLAAISREEQLGQKPDPQIRQAVLIARNRDWSSVIARSKGRPFIAVGTGHLTGQDNLIQLLEARGFRITRIQ